MPPQLLQNVVGIAVIVLVLPLLHRLLHFGWRQNPALHPQRFSFITQHKSARRGLVRHHDLGTARFFASPLHLPKQSRSPRSIVYETKSFTLFSFYRDPRYRVLVSQINSNENVSHHGGL